jgi:hypothetical protein
MSGINIIKFFNKLFKNTNFKKIVTTKKKLKTARKIIKYYYKCNLNIIIKSNDISIR